MYRGSLPQLSSLRLRKPSRATAAAERRTMAAICAGSVNMFSEHWQLFMYRPGSMPSDAPSSVIALTLGNARSFHRGLPAAS